MVVPGSSLKSGAARTAYFAYNFFDAVNGLHIIIKITLIKITLMLVESW